MRTALERLPNEDREFILGGLSSEELSDVLTYYKTIVIALCASVVAVKDTLEIDKFAIQMMTYYRHTAYPRETHHDDA